MKLLIIMLILFIFTKEAISQEHTYSMPFVSEFIQDTSLPDKLEDGRWIVYYPNSKIIALDAFYKNMKKQGRWTLYYLNGNKKEQLWYENGKEDLRIAHVQWYMNGNIFLEATRIDSCIQRITFYENGVIKAINFFTTYEIRKRNDHLGENATSDGFGHWYEFNENGCVKSDKIWNEGFNGKNRIYTCSNITFEDNAIEYDSSLLWYPCGTKRCDFVDIGKRDTMININYKPTGKIESKGLLIFSHDIKNLGLKRSGKWEIYDDLGNIVEEQEYFDDKLIRSIKK